MQVSDLTRNRIASEAQRIARQEISLEPKSLLDWRGVITPQAGKWKGGTFRVRITLPPNYPDQKPTVVFLDKPRPRHPNISPSGWPCLNILMHAWSDRETLISIWDGLNDLFLYPDYDKGFTTDSYVRNRSQVPTPSKLSMPGLSFPGSLKDLGGWGR